MKKKTRPLLLLALLTGLTLPSRAQGLIETMTEQLAKLELYLHETEQGYAIFQKGLSTISDIKNGEFHLHQLFLGSLQTVSPSIKKYTRVADILALQLRILSGCSDGIQRFVRAGLFSAVGRQYLQAVYNQLQDFTSKDIDELTDLITDGKLQLSDDERLHRIDGLYAAVQDKYAFLVAFNSRTSAMALNANREKQDLQYLQKIVQP